MRTRWFFFLTSAARLARRVSRLSVSSPSIDPDDSRRWCSPVGRSSPRSVGVDEAELESWRDIPSPSLSALD